MNILKPTLPALLAGFVLLGSGCGKKPPVAAPAAEETTAETGPVYPFSDPENKEGWILNEEVSDEFEGTKLDDSKWFVQGTGGGFHKWKGRAPSQFAPHNVIVGDGMVKLRTQWEPDYDFAKEQFDGRPYENITTAGMVSRKKFLYGYMEIKSKAADAAVTSSFWTLGYQSELDMFEQMGSPTLPQKKAFSNSYMFSIHDWRPGVVAGENKIFTHTHQLDYRVADDFHVYGCEWGKDYLKVYADGKLVYSTTQKELGDAWILTNPLELWLDSETFPWFGLPEKEHLPADFEVEYVRVWQKPDPNLLDRAFFGFEGPLVLKELPLPESDKSARLEWYVPKELSHHFSIVGDKFATGRKSLRFTHDGELANSEVAAFSPYGSVSIPEGAHVLSFLVWLEPGCDVRKIHPILENPWLQLKPVDLSGFETGKWVPVTIPFSREQASADRDRLRWVVHQADVGDGAGTLFIDNVVIRTADAE